MTPQEPILPSKPGIIYLARNKVNGKCYVGQTTYRLSHRKGGHFVKAKLGSTLAFHQAIQKYGEGAFEFVLLQDCCGRDCLNEAEKWWIRHFDCIAPRGYNLTYGGDVPVVSEETRRKMSEIQKHLATPEKMEALRKAAAEKGPSQRQREVASQMMKARIGDKHPNFGRKLSGWHKQRVSETHKGKKQSEEQIRKRTFHRRGVANPKLQGLIAWNRGMKFPDSGRKGTMTGEENPFYGKKHTPETIAKMSAARTAYHARRKEELARKKT